MLDTISDMLTRIRNAQMAGHKEVEMPFSKLKLAIAKILEEKNFKIPLPRKARTRLLKSASSLNMKIFQITKKFLSSGGSEGSVGKDREFMSRKMK